MKSKKPGGKREEFAQPKVDWKALETVHPNAAGIDVGGKLTLSDIPLFISCLR